MVPETPLEPARRVTGFRWQEAEPYGWPRVLATSFLTSAATLGLLYVALGSCFEERDAGLGPDFACDSGPPAVAAGLLTGTVVTFSTRWAGGTSLSNGWALPSLGLGSVSSIAGYLLLIKGETTESSGARTAGLGVLALGTPLVVALADRVFRVLR
jgi:hypothetical protein